jgi:hypothetical protein
MWNIFGGEIVRWRFEREGRSWQSEEAFKKYELTPGKIEMIHGKIFWSEEERVNMLGLMLENIGIDKMLGLFDDLSLLKEAISEREYGNG